MTSEMTLVSVCTVYQYFAAAFFFFDERKKEGGLLKGLKMGKSMNHRTV